MLARYYKSKGEFRKELADSQAGLRRNKGDLEIWIPTVLEKPTASSPNRT